MISKDLVAASAKPLILSILAEGDNYGYRIIRRVRELSDNKLSWKEGMLYPVLHKLEQQGIIESEWRIVENGRQRKYYSLKREGYRMLEREKEQWDIVTMALNKLWGARECLT